MAFSSLDLYYLTKELQDLIGTRISQVYHPDKYTIILEIYNARTGKKYLWLNIASNAEIKEIKESKENPTGFCMFLRKYLGNGKIRSIQQRGFDRILEITIEQFAQPQASTQSAHSKGETNEKEFYILIAEFFSKGNLCITNKSYEIMQCLEVQEWKDRTLKQKEIYKSPAEQINPLELPQNKIQEIIKSSTRQNIVKTLAIDLSFGGEYAETILSLTKINKEQKTVSEKEIKQIYKVIQNLKTTKPTKIESSKSAIKTHSKEELKQQQLEIQRQKEIVGLKSILQTQNIKIDEMKLEEETERKKGDLIYENYEECENAIKLKKTEIKLSEIKIKIDPKKSLAENAAFYYEIAKKSKQRAEGAVEALMQTQNKIQELEANLTQLKEKQTQQEREKREKRKPEWYEKYHWFYSSDNFLCIGGKDAVSNEIIVKKYAEKSELVFHTESPGSPFFVIKNPNNLEIPKTTLEETAQATASYSQTWKSNIGTTEVLYVKAEQLTKAEGVQKGMFIIEGKKTVLRPILKLAIANVNNQIICGPVSAIKSHSQNTLTIIQGDLTKNELAKKIKSKLGGDLEEIERMLPNGKSKIEK